MYVLHGFQLVSSYYLQAKAVLKTSQCFPKLIYLLQIVTYNHINSIGVQNMGPAVDSLGLG